MSTGTSASGKLPSRTSGFLPSGSDALTLGAIALGFLALFLPTYIELSSTIWASDEQGHGPIILGVAFWLLYRLRDEILALPDVENRWPGFLLLGMGLLLHGFGRSQYISILEVGSQSLVIAGLLATFKGMAAVRLAAFPLFFLLFMVPLPGQLVAAVTTPLKSLVSYVAEFLMYHAGYPIARSGVILHVGQYQLLVADACAGLNSMFTLEALGLLYMNLMGYKSVSRNLTLAILIIPIAFFANVIRVMILILVTFHFGDEAGQGFVHDFAGMVLFMVGLIMMLIVDKGLAALYFDRKGKEAA
jgi:exosortase B